MRVFGVAAGLMLWCLVPCVAGAAEYFVAPGGQDGWEEGSIERPFRTLAKAASVAKPGDVVYLRAGDYREVLRPARSGEAGKEIVFANWRNERAVLLGTEPLRGWRDEGEGVYSAAMPWS